MNPLFPLINDILWQATYVRDTYQEDPSIEERQFLHELARDLFDEITEQNIHQNIWAPLQNSVVALQDSTLPASALVETATQIIQIVTPIFNQGEAGFEENGPLTEEELQIAAQEQAALSKEVLRKKIFLQFSDHLLYAEKSLDLIYSDSNEELKELFESYDESVFICFPILVEFLLIKNARRSFEDFGFVHLSKDQLAQILSLPINDFMTCIFKRFLNQNPAGDHPLFASCWTALYKEVESRRNINMEIIHLAIQRRDEKLDDRMNQCLSQITEGSLSPNSAIDFMMSHEAIRMIPSLPLGLLNQDDTEELLFWLAARGQVDPMVKIFKLNRYEFNRNLLLSLFQEAAQQDHFHLFLPLLNEAPIDSTTVIRLTTICVENGLTRGLDAVIQSKFRKAIPRHAWNQFFNKALKTNQMKTVRWMIERSPFEFYSATFRSGFRSVCEKGGNASLAPHFLPHPATAQFTPKEWSLFFQWMRSIPIEQIDQMLVSVMASPGFKNIETPHILNFIDYLMEQGKISVAAALLRPIVRSLLPQDHLKLLQKAIACKIAPLAIELLSLPVDTGPEIRGTVLLSLVSNMDPSLTEKYLSDPLSALIPPLFLFRGLVDSAQANLPNTFQMIANALLRVAQFPDIPAPLLMPQIINSINNKQFAMIRHLLMLPSARLVPWSSLLLFKGLFQAAEAEEISLVKQYLTLENPLDPLATPVYQLAFTKMLESGEIETAAIMYNDHRVRSLDQQSLFQISRHCIRKNAILAFDFMALFYPYLIDLTFAQQVILEAEANGRPEIAEKARTWLFAMNR